MRSLNHITLAVVATLSVFSSTAWAEDITLDNLRDLSKKLDTLQGEPRRQLINQLASRPSLVANWAKELQILNSSIENRLISIDRYVGKGQEGFANGVAANLRPVVEKTTEMTKLSSKVVSQVVSDGTFPDRKAKAQFLRAGAFITANSVFIRTEHYGGKSVSDIRRIADMDQTRDKNEVPRGERTRNGQMMAKRLLPETMNLLKNVGLIERWSKIEATESFKFKASSSWIKVPVRINPLDGTGLEPFGGSGVR